MSLVGCFATPHPPVIVPAVGGARVDEVRATFDAMEAAAAEMTALAPEVVVIVSPHAPLDMGRMGVSLAGDYVGSFEMFGAPTSRVNVHGDPVLADEMVRATAEAGIPVRARREGATVELDHGAMVPLWFFAPALTDGAVVVVVSFSYLDARAHVGFGRALGTVLRADPRRAVFVASGDLSHRLLPGAPAGFHPRAAEFDRFVVERFVAGDLAALAEVPQDLVQTAGECGLRSLQILAGVLEGMRWRPRLLSYEGPFGVGYLVGAIDVDPTDEVGPGREGVIAAGEDEDHLVALARAAVEAHVLTGDTGSVEALLPPGVGPGASGVFVSLHLPDGRLRGCIGTLQATRPTLADEIVSNAVNAAANDPRFPPVGPAELPGLRVAVDVLGEPEPVDGLDDLDPSRYGIIVRTTDGRQALLLPDLEGVDSAQQQLRITCRKGRIDPDRDDYAIYRFEVRRHGRH